MKLFGVKLNAGKIASTVAKVAVPIVAVAVVTKTPVRKALENAARKAVRDEMDKAGA